MQTWTVINDGRHNAFTDLIYWHDAFWLIYVAAPSHFGSARSRLVLLRSTDAVHWTEMARFSGNGQDIRDPKLAVIKGQLWVYALLNRRFDPQPDRTVCAHSADGRTWTAFEDVTSSGWLLGKPQSPDGVTWYAPAHHLTQGIAQILISADGLQWTTHATIYDHDGVDETALVFTSDQTLVTVSRLESNPTVFGSPTGGTLVSRARPPYQKWDTQFKSTLTRLDSPALFVHNRVYAVGRFQPQVGGRFHQHGSILSRKRTAVFAVDDQALIHLLDLPSNGDTAYAGVVIRDGAAFVSYYTNALQHDVPWLLGMVRPTQIQLARLPLAELSDHNRQR